MDYLEMNRRQRRALARRAEHGDKEAMKVLRKATWNLKVEVNKRIRALKKARLDYGSPVNNLMYFTQTQYRTEKLLSPNELNNDAWDMALQNEQALKFLRNEGTIPEVARDRESHRIKRLMEMDALPKKFTRRTAIEFLRWLGSEEATAAIDEYGRSDTIVEMAYDMYKKQGTTGLNTISKAVADFMANKKAITLDEALERVGVKIEDYLHDKTGH